MKMNSFGCRCGIVYVCKRFRINDNILNHQILVLNKLCSVTYIFKEYVFCFVDKVFLFL